MKRKAVLAALCISSIALLSLSGCKGKDKEDGGEEQPYFVSNTMESFFAAASETGSEDGTGGNETANHEPTEVDDFSASTGDNELTGNEELTEDSEALAQLPLKGIKIALGEEPAEDSQEEAGEEEPEEEPPYFASNTTAIFIQTKADMDAEAEAKAQAEAEANAAALAEVVAESATLLQTNAAPLTQTEIDSLKSGASGDRLRSIDIYESVTQTGSYSDPNGSRITQVVGIPGDTSWRRMSDEEAQAIVNAGEPKQTDYPEDENGAVQYQHDKDLYQAALRESGAVAWNGAWLKNIYFYDYYKYVEYNKRMVAINLALDRIASCVPIGAEDYLSSGEEYNSWKAAHPEEVARAEEMWSRISSQQRDRYNALFLQGESQGDLSSDVDKYVWEYIQFYLDRL